VRAADPERGGVPIEFALGVGLLVLPIALMVLVFPTWTERQSMARLAAQEAARTVVLADDFAAGSAAGTGLAQEIAANHDLAGAIQAVEFSGSLERGATVEVTVRVTIPAPAIPFFGSGGAISWSVRHAEQVDAYRSFP